MTELGCDPEGNDMGLGYETEFPFDDDRTEEDRNREYLRQHPDHERALWRDWVLEVCKRRQVPAPDGLEWVTLAGQWHHNKTPITSVDELEAMRKQPNKGFEQADIAPQDTQLSVFDEGVRFAERHHQIKGKQ